MISVITISGVSVGRLVGTGVTLPPVGFNEGLMDSEGPADGAEVGSVVTVPVGFSEGFMDSEGPVDGAEVGSGVFLSVGFNDGLPDEE